MCLQQMCMRVQILLSFNVTEPWELHIQGMAEQSGNYTGFI